MGIEEASLVSAVVGCIPLLESHIALLKAASLY